MDGEMYVRVMTEEQIEMLRQQIAAYGSICEQLINAYKSITASKRNPSSLITGMGLGTMYCDTPVMSGSYRMPGRQRWTPTIGQFEFLERIFEQENGSPSKQRIKEIASELSQHGPITEANVYNWFQNRRARSKRKQAGVSSNVEPEVETEVESLYEKRTRLWKMHSYENQALIDYNSSSQSLEVSSEGHRDDPEPHRILYLHPSNDNSNSSGSQDEISFYENVPSNFSMNHGQPPGGGRCGF